MDVKITEAEKGKRFLDITLSREEFKPHYDKSLKNYRKKVQLKGFRKGKAPISLVSQMYGGAILEKAVTDSLPVVLSDIYKQHDLRPIGPAQVETVDYRPDSELKVRALVEILPEITLEKYTGFDIDHVIYEVTDEDLETALEDIREQHGWLESIETGAQPGHIIQTDLQEVDQAGLPLVGHKYEDRQFVVSEHAAAPDDFTPQLIGAKVGESRVVKVSSQTPEGGTKVKFFRVEIKEVSEKKLPF